MELIHVKGLTIGEGMAKICVPLVGRDSQEIEQEIDLVKASKADLVEWRVDFLDEWDNRAAVMSIAKIIREKLKSYPILFTFRTASEGGNQEPSLSYYRQLYGDVIKTELVDLIDIEFALLENMSELVDLATINRVKIITSYHNFESTPSQGVLLDQLHRMTKSCGDICKIAVMPSNLEDVLRLFEVTNKAVSEFSTKPVVTISMGSLGKLTRAGGTVFGSAITFGSLKNSSAPGQIEVNQLKNIMESLS